MFEEKQTNTTTKHPTFLSRNRGQKYRAYKDEGRKKNLKRKKNHCKPAEFSQSRKTFNSVTQKIKPIAIYLPVDNQLETKFPVTTSLQKK